MSGHGYSGGIAVDRDENCVLGVLSSINEEFNISFVVDLAEAVL
jgi:hypothetical protein